MRNLRPPDKLKTAVDVGSRPVFLIWSRLPAVAPRGGCASGPSCDYYIAVLSSVSFLYVALPILRTLSQIRCAQIVTADNDLPPVLLHSTSVGRSRDSDHSTFNTQAGVARDAWPAASGLVSASAPDNS